MINIKPETYKQGSFYIVINSFGEQVIKTNALEIANERYQALLKEYLVQQK